jgi:Protein of unknown function (DUF3224)
MRTVRGEFDVTMHAEPPYFDRDGVTLARATFDKTFHGPLSATGSVQFLSVRAGTNAAYVAIERIEGTLEGRRGSFVVTHKATASSSAMSLTVEIVSGTGTEELQGLEGTIDIEIVDGKHYYTMHYELPGVR